MCYNHPLVVHIRFTEIGSVGPSRCWGDRCRCCWHFCGCEAPWIFTDHPFLVDDPQSFPLTPSAQMQSSGPLVFRWGIHHIRLYRWSNMYGLFWITSFIIQMMNSSYTCFQISLSLSLLFVPCLCIEPKKHLNLRFLFWWRLFFLSLLN